MKSGGRHLIKTAMEKAKTTGTDAVIKAKEGLFIDILQEPFSVRPLDHQAGVPCRQGTITKIQLNLQPFSLLVFPLAGDSAQAALQGSSSSSPRAWL